MIEIIELPDRDNWLNEYIGIFDESYLVAKLDDFKLQKSIKDDVIHYGLFDDDFLFGYLKIIKFNETYHQVLLSQLHPRYKLQGYGTFMYDYVIMNDKIQLLSDSHQTKSAKFLWKVLKRNGRYKVFAFKLDTSEIFELEKTTDDEFHFKMNGEDKIVHGDSEDFLLLATQTNHYHSRTISEELKFLNNRHNNGRLIVWYGPETLSEIFINP